MRNLRKFVQARRCARCGDLASVDVTPADDPLVPDDLCAPCAGEFAGARARLRAEFQALKDSGMSDAEANLEMIARTDRLDAPK